MKRRDFIKQTGFAILGQSALMSVAPFGISHALAGDKKVFIKVFLRGGMDGLSLLAPKSNAQFNIYKNARPDLHIPKSQMLALKNVPEFGLHPEAVRLRSLFNNAQAIFAHGAGSTNITRSHFTQQDIIEGGDSTQIKNSGYLFRALQSSGKTLDMVSIGKKLAYSMKGTGTKAVSLASPESYSRLQGPRKLFEPKISKKQRLVGMATNNDGNCSDFGGGARGTFCRQAVEVGRSIDSIDGSISGMVKVDPKDYGASSIGKSLMQAVRMASTSRLNTHIINVDMGGWDTHLEEGVLNGRFKNNVAALDKALGAAKDDLVKSGLWNKTVIMVMSEFGRTLAQNGTGGTDHGRGGVMLMLGGNLNSPGRVIAPNFNLSNLDIRDVRVEVDYRKIAAEMLLDHLKLPDTEVQKAFPGLALRSGFFNLF